MTMAETERRPRLNRGCLLVLQALESNQRVCSAQDIHMWLKANEPEAPGLTTIYRALDTLLNLHLVQTVEFGDGEKRYEAVEPGEHHHHLTCNVCQTNIHLDQCFIDSLTEGIRARHGFEARSHVLEI